MNLNTNIYHQDYAVGEYIKLVQIYHQRSEYERFVLHSEDLLRLISQRKINCRYVKVKKVMMKITERVEYDHLTAGFVGLIEQSCVAKLGIGHNQYPVYDQQMRSKFKWKVYWVNLSAHGKVIEEEYEDHQRVVQLINHRYVPARLRLAIEPIVKVADPSRSPATRWD